MKSEKSDRRQFLKTTAALTTGIAGIGMIPSHAYSGHALSEDSWKIVGPMEGFSPHVGTVLSMLNMMNYQILQPVKDLTVEQLDYLQDAQSNSIGAMLFHMAATEAYYQLNTFDDMKWGSWGEDVKKKWDVAMNLGDEARKQIKGNSLDYYLNILKETREKTREGFKQKDDDWLMKVDPEWGWNNYAKWFHVAEHYSNHNGQIKWIKNRLPGAKAGRE